jgi:hypothetical protein
MAATRKTPNTPSPPGSPGLGHERGADTPQTPSPPVQGNRGAYSVQEQKFEPATIIQVRVGVSSSSLDDETIVADGLSNRFFRLNKTGSFIWNQIATEARFVDLWKCLREEYGLEDIAAGEALSLFLADLIDAGLVVASTRPGGEVVMREEAEKTEFS